MINPAPDPSRAVDAELRAALFELVTDRPLAALSRLEVQRANAAVTGSPVATESRQELLFLLAQGYYRIGMRDAFRVAANELVGLAGGGRHAGIVRSQLVLDAYRRGDFARVIGLAAEAGAAGDRPLASLVAGLAQYQTANYAAAGESFATVADGVFAPYARYMGALASLQGATDSARAAGAIEALRSLGSDNAVGGGQEFVDQARVTAAQLAYQAAQYDAAASLAQTVSPGSGMAAQALLTRAWALYRAKQLDAAASAFTEFATRYPQLPSRDEARLMAGQIMLESNRVDEAERYFQSIADSLNSELGATQASTGGSLGEAARALVAARAAGVVILSEPQSGKTLALADAAGADQTVLLNTFSEGMTPVVASLPSPEIISFADVEARLNGIAALGNVPRRVLYASAPGGAGTASLIDLSDGLLAADAALALARFRLQEQIDAQAARIATLQALQQFMTNEAATSAQHLAQITAAQDSLTVMAGVIDRARTRVAQFVQQQINETRSMSAANVTAIDSMRAALGASVGTVEGNLLGIERETALLYGQLANMIAQGIDAAIARHPVFALQDSIRRRLDRARALYAETQSLISQNTAFVEAEMARLQGSESDRTKAMRVTMASAESRRTAVESQLIVALESELRARANRTLALLRHDTEAAEFGSASAAFFRAIEAGRTGSSGAQGTSVEVGGTVGGNAREQSGVAGVSTPRNAAPTTPRR